ncbi:MAG: hypothetical protein ACRECA_10175 [Pseudolabrys sp.]
MSRAKTLRRLGVLAAAALLATAIGAMPVYAVDDNTKSDQKKTITKKSKAKTSQDAAPAPGTTPYPPNEPQHGGGY